MKFINIMIFLFFIIFSFGQSPNISNDNSTTLGVIDNYKDPINKTMISQQKKAEVLSRLNLQGIELPLNVDNSYTKYTRPIFSQVGGSCGSASRICYMFAHEINSYRKLDGSLPENKYPSHFTWMLTGQNSSKEAMAKGNGVPNSIVYEGDTYSKKYGGKDVGWPNLDEAPDYGWMQGYDKWYHAMSNRLEKNEFLNLDTPENLLILKSWLFNHHGDTSFAVGAIAGAGVAISNSQMIKIPSGYKAGKYFIKNWGPQVDHGVSWSGYDDNIAYDFNGDGKFTNDIDITGDGNVDMADWEIGALIMLNSWGSGWGNNGTVYVPYRLLKINNMNAELYYIRKDYKPLKVMKILMSYSQRSKLKISVGIANGHTATKPSKSEVCQHFNNAGNGDVPMLGKWTDGVIHDEAMEFGYDLTDLNLGYNTKEPYTYYLKILSKFFSTGVGKIHSVSVIDYSTDPQGIEYNAEVSEVDIKNNGQYTYMAVRMPADMDGTMPDYVYIPQDGLTIKYCDSQETVGEDGKAENIIDGDVSTIWHTEWSDNNPTHPHEIQINLGKSYSVSGIEYLPRQSSPNGRIKDYEIYLSEDGENWNSPVHSGSFTNSSEKSLILFDKISAGFIKMVALSEVNGNPWTAIAEINVLQSVTTSVDEINDEFISSYSLSQNYPNPFNPETTIEFYIPKSGQVKIDVLNLLGEKIAALLDETKLPGKHKVIFDGKNLPSGIYFYKISTEEWSETKKMILLK